MSDATPDGPEGPARSAAQTDLDELRRRMRRDRKELRRQLRHQRQFLTIMASLAGIFAISIAAFIGFIHIADTQNFEQERNDLEKFQRNLKEQFLGKSQTTIVLGGPQNKPLDGEVIDGTVITNPPKPTDWDRKHNKSYALYVLRFRYIIRNTGQFSSGDMLAKFYFKKPMHTAISNPSDDPSFDYEAFILPESFDVRKFPGQASGTVSALIPIYTVPNAGEYPIMLKLYYGDGKMVPASFQVRLNGKAISHEEAVSVPNQ